MVTQTMDPGLLSCNNRPARIPDVIKKTTIKILRQRDISFSKKIGSLLSRGHTRGSLITLRANSIKNNNGHTGDSIKNSRGYDSF